ncbi:NAD(P)/FAD-dependent oxidoreductase [Bdellovibrio sp. 22V]|uniref:flavin monoamine oxidase family protein n=1 Tax=Bdellovibrio sp. 22V TaxID=3044166 RepID=UPI0025439E95|nr:NAD(P)/FAD-dependent oxidoreductase [Bdellovibrio sp. 22V]WII73687.1 NAD(P)/FAD-dependent oxidoreductase [Bdellovibrio sp. 22V]
MAKSSLTRREFLKISAMSSSALALSSCTTLDRYFMGDKRNLTNEVVILGAGAAGLSAGFELKKRKIPFRVFEASSRVGGRVQSIPLFGLEGAVAELGAEFFDSSHTAVLSLAKELNISVSEIKAASGEEAHLFAFDKKTYRVKDMASRLKTLQNPMRRIRSDLFREQDVILSYKNAVQFERSLYYDTLSLQDLLNSWKDEVDPLVLKLIEVQAVNRFGVDAKEQSSLHFLSTIDAEGSSLLSGRTTYRMNGGLSSLMQTLSARVAGVIPDHVMKLNMVLTEINEEDGVFQLFFRGPNGTEVFTARNIICTLPFSKLKEVKGIGDLSFSNIKKENILNQAYATHSKGTVVFPTPFWKNRRGNTPANVGNFTGDFVSQKMWDSGRSQPVTRGLLTFQRAGASGLKAGAEAARDAANDLELFYKDVPEYEKERTQIANWSQRPWAGGSMAFFKPGQYMRFKGVAAEAEYEGRFLFAGEHTSARFAGTLQGALESGLRAASEVSI